VSRTDVVYLLHFDQPYGDYPHGQFALHYLGSTSDLPARLQAHRTGKGARLMTVIRRAGIDFSLARTWPGGKCRERQLKQQHRRQMCPMCGVMPRDEQGRRVFARRTLTARREAEQAAVADITAAQVAETDQDQAAYLQLIEPMAAVVNALEASWRPSLATAGGTR
jgi:predicted GIY-YIG superfamily endonuclease